MNKIKYLPLGSVVNIKGTVKKFIIVSRGLAVNANGKESFFDYAGCLFPEGMMDKKLNYFNHDKIVNVVFNGCEDEMGLNMSDEINKWFVANNYEKDASDDNKRDYSAVVNSVMNIGENKYLPLGSVVQLKDSEIRIMIIGRTPVSPIKGNLYCLDYMGCVFPFGVEKNQFLYFSNEDIDILHFTGLINDEEKLMQDILSDAATKCGYLKANVRMFLEE